MSTSAAQLLQSLGSGVRTGGANLGRGSGTGVDAANGSFADLLRAADQGQVSSGAPVKIAKTAGLDLNPAQLGKLAVAADRATSEGADRALVLMDGMALQLDVATRTVTGLAKVTPGTKMPQVLTGVDTVITVPSDADAQAQAVPLAQLTASGPINASLMKLLSNRNQSSTDSDSSDQQAA